MSLSTVWLGEIAEGSMEVLTRLMSIHHRNGGETASITGGFLGSNFLRTSITKATSVRAFRSDRSEASEAREYN